MWPFKRVAFKLPSLRLQLDRSIRTPFLISYLFAAIASFLAVGFYLQLSPVIPLFYTLAERSAQLTIKEWIFFFPVFALTVSVLHTIIVQGLHERGRVVARLFAWSTVMIQLILTLCILRIIMIIT